MDNDFVKKYINLVRNIAHTFKNTGIDFEDLVQEGLLGLCEAHNKYDENRGASFPTFATHCIKNKILAYVIKENKHFVEINESHTQSSTAPITDHSAPHKALPLPDDMPEMEKIILNLYFVEKKTLIEIAETLNTTREKTRQLKNKAMRRYKNLLTK